MFFPRRELWRQIAKEFNGQFNTSHTAGCELETLLLYIPYAKCTIKLSESDTKPLKFEIELKSQQEYELI